MTTDWLRWFTAVPDGVTIGQPGQQRPDTPQPVRQLLQPARACFTPGGRCPSRQAITSRRPPGATSTTSSKGTVTRCRPQPRTSSSRAGPAGSAATTTSSTTPTARPQSSSTRKSWQPASTSVRAGSPRSRSTTHCHTRPCPVSGSLRSRSPTLGSHAAQPSALDSRHTRTRSSKGGKPNIPSLSSPEPSATIGSSMHTRGVGQPIFEPKRPWPHSKGDDRGSGSDLTRLVAVGHQDDPLHAAQVGTCLPAVSDSTTSPTSMGGPPEPEHPAPTLKLAPPPTPALRRPRRTPLPRPAPPATTPARDPSPAPTSSWHRSHRRPGCPWTRSDRPPPPRLTRPDPGPRLHRRLTSQAQPPRQPGAATS
jgi:hypothetical protein